MLKKMGIGIVVLAVVLCMTTGMGMAEQSSSSSSVKETLDELQILWEDFAQLKKVTPEGIGERLEVAKAKEDVLYELAVWQGKLVSELITKASMRITRITKVEERITKVEKQVKEQAEINEELRTSIASLAKRKANVADVEKQVKEQAKINKELQASIEKLKDKVKYLENEVSLAKKIAATAQIRADQAIAEMEDLAQQTEERIAMLMAKVNDLVIRVKNLEKELGEKPVIKLKSLEFKETSVK